MMGMRLKEDLTIARHNVTLINTDILADFDKMRLIDNLKESSNEISFNMTSKGRLVANSILGKLLR